MSQLPFLPQWPFAANPLALFGVLLLAGLVGGELTKRVFRLPRITGMFWSAWRSARAA